MSSIEISKNSNALYSGRVSEDCRCVHIFDLTIEDTLRTIIINQVLTELEKTGKIVVEIKEVKC